MSPRVDGASPLQVEELTLEMVEKLSRDEWEAVIAEMRFSIELLDSPLEEEGLFELNRVQGLGLDPFLPDDLKDLLKACRRAP